MLDIGKAKKVLSSAFVENADSMGGDELRKQLAMAEKQIKDLNDEKAADEKLIAAKKIAKDLSSGYQNAVKYEEAKIRYIIERLEEIGE